jgi:FkbM family methyltransferase
VKYSRIRLRRYTKDAIKSVLKSLDIGITRYRTLERLRGLESAQNDIEFLQTLYHPGVAPAALQYLHKCLECMPKSKSQYRQDLFVLSQLGFKTKGFFVEFGATDGVGLSNTFLLEKEFQWTGILAEPARCWHDALRRNRAAIIETCCVWRDSHSTLTFNEVENAGLSTISTCNDCDLHQAARRNGSVYTVKSISLLDLLEEHNAPTVVDFLSIDTEGSEYEILGSFDFSKFRFRVITCEHNYTPMREQIFQLLTKNGYSRVFQQISYNDDWYIST